MLVFVETSAVAAAGKDTAHRPVTVDGWWSADPVIFPGSHGHWPPP
jgi:hypothetical protein